MNFYEKMNQTVNNVSVTENGMTGYKTTYHPLLDMFFKVSSYRSLDDKDIIKDFKEIIKSNDFSYALRFLFMIRDVREGLGERRLFKICLKELLKCNFLNKQEIINDIITKYIPEYGRYDDLFCLIDTEYSSLVDDFVLNTLKEDFTNMKENKPISLLAKWLPSENASSLETKKLAKHFIESLNTTPREYRKTLSTLRSYIDVVEVKMSAKEWGEIDYNKVPSKANLKYQNAFLRNDEERRREYLNKLAVGDSSVKMNGSVNYPHEIVHAYRSNGYYSNAKDYNETLEQLWKNLKQVEGLENTIVVRDGSGSMETKVGGTSITAMDISTALTIYCAERLDSDFKNKFITFSHDAKLIDLDGCASLKTKLDKAYKENDCSNTDLENVFNLILKTAVDHNMANEDLPKQVLIVSDMEFDPAHESSNGWYSSGMKMNFDTNVITTVSEKFKKYGYTLPKLIFWNVASRTNTIPCKENENGVLLISGFSVNILNMVLNGETDAFKNLITELEKERYSNIPLLFKYTELKQEIKEIKTPDFLK